MRKITKLETKNIELPKLKRVAAYARVSVERGRTNLQALWQKKKKKRTNSKRNLDNIYFKTKYKTVAFPKKKKKKTIPQGSNVTFTPLVLDLKKLIIHENQYNLRCRNLGS